MNSGQRGFKMTPERMLELACYLADQNSKPEDEIAALLRECAKPEPVGYFVDCGSGDWDQIDKDAINATPLYAAPQPDNRDERIKELEAQLKPSPIDERQPKNSEELI